MTGVSSWNVHPSFRVTVQVWLSSLSMDSAMARIGSAVSASSRTRPVKMPSTTLPPPTSLVLLGISGFSGSVLLTETEPAASPDPPSSSLLQAASASERMAAPATHFALVPPRMG